MAIKKNIRITFNKEFEIGDILKFKGTFTENGNSITTNFQEEWKSVRTNSFEVTTDNQSIFEITSFVVGTQTAINFYNAFGFDYIQYGFSITRTNNVIEIESPLAGNLNFMFDGFLEGQHSGNVIFPTDVTIEYFNGHFMPFYFLSNENDIFSMADSNFCQTIKATLQTNTAPVEIISPIPVANNTDNPFSFDLQRGQSFIVSVKNESSMIISQNITIPPLLTPDAFTLQINNSPFGASVTITNNYSTADSYQLDLQYSLNNISWQSTNSFIGITEGHYYLFIKDRFGCIIQKEFKIKEENIYRPYFYISKANSIRYANRVEWGDSINYKNDENTLSCEVLDKLPYKEIQLFQTSDKITTQFKSNYAINKAFVLTENGTTIEIPVNKKSTNINNKDKRDAKQYDLGNGKMGIYFTSGNIYNFTTNTVIEQHYLNGNVPIWAKSGGYIIINNQWFLIDDILYDDDKFAEVIVINTPYMGVEQDVIIGSIYNIFDYEIYEFELDFINYSNQTIKVKIELQDDNFETITLLSEDLDIQVRHTNALEIKYWNDDNTDLFYATGIKNTIRISYEKIIDATEENSEIHKTDVTILLLNASIYEGTEIEFSPITLEMMRKLRIALNCKNITINSISYVKTGSLEVEQLEDTNLYTVKAKLLKAGSVYSSQSNGVSDFNTSSSEIPGLLNINNDSFLKY